MSPENKALIERAMRGSMACPYDGWTFTPSELNTILHAAREEGWLKGYAAAVEDAYKEYMAENP